MEELGGAAIAQPSRDAHDIVVDKSVNAENPFLVRGDRSADLWEDHGPLGHGLALDDPYGVRIDVVVGCGHDSLIAGKVHVRDLEEGERAALLSLKRRRKCVACTNDRQLTESMCFHAADTMPTSSFASLDRAASSTGTGPWANK